MEDNILKTEYKLCHCCMEEHDVKTVEHMEQGLYNGVSFEYICESEYCDRCDSYLDDEDRIRLNQKSYTEARNKAMVNVLIKRLDSLL